ncbi:MAG: hypothetical protein Ct9H300mP1_33490 [Planctomycetaceae bacterium]|nr:MAG: hypothetical protein Ct9H300mP1_33490 [Planctomycetaceae bacterium]
MPLRQKIDTTNVVRPDFSGSRGMWSGFRSNTKPHTGNSSVSAEITVFNNELMVVLNPDQVHQLRPNKR